MVEWLNENVAYWHWIVFGILLCGMEIFTTTFVLLWFGVAGIIVGILLSLVTMSFAWQLGLWAIFSILLMILWHTQISPRMANKTLAGLSLEAVVGQVGTVLSYSTLTNRGQLRFPAPVLGNDEWEFICTSALQSGDRVVVSSVSGNSLIVTPKM